jgi:hypothetical protein
MTNAHGITSQARTNHSADNELTDAQLEAVAGGFFSDLIRRGQAIYDAQNHPVIKILEEQMK